MAKARRRDREEARGLYRCPNINCKHKWEAALNWNANCPKCNELQGPVALK